ncbi:hypothetical protein [Rhodococcus phage RGL3]|uniref:Uncharacterized protein n=1 Tax=Rhodococcus phage RGL3 TaxID=2922221 RepID=G9FHP4_9CAUD|nr:hypothetical protein RoPhRGL3_gp52 [Rhodococcus phage RGL3]AEV52132.1 hypothetical protein [Rhodococcus phage RGL3]
MIESKSLGELEGFEVEAGWVYDDMTPDFYGEEAYDAEAVEAFNNGDWSFVILTVEARFNGHVMGTAHLGGVELGFFPGATEILDPLTDPEYLDDLIREALDEARSELHAVITKGIEVLV